MIAVDDNALREAVGAAVEQAMEAMFFDAAEPVTECECACTVSATIACIVHFSDGIEGDFVLVAPLETAIALAASFMAFDLEAVERRHAEQTVCELANIICGSALSRLEPSSELRLRPPEIVECPPEDGLRQHYRLLDGCISLSIRLKA